MTVHPVLKQGLIYPWLQTRWKRLGVGWLICSGLPRTFSILVLKYHFLGKPGHLVTLLWVKDLGPVCHWISVVDIVFFWHYPSPIFLLPCWQSPPLLLEAKNGRYFPSLSFSEVWSCDLVANKTKERVSWEFLGKGFFPLYTLISPTPLLPAFGYCHVRMWCLELLQPSCDHEGTSHNITEGSKEFDNELTLGPQISYFCDNNKSLLA